MTRLDQISVGKSLDYLIKPCQTSTQRSHYFLKSCQKNPRKAGSRFVDVAATTTSITEHCASRRVDNDNLVKNKHRRPHRLCPTILLLLLLSLLSYYSPTSTRILVVLLFSYFYSYSCCLVTILPLLLSLSS